MKRESVGVGLGRLSQPFCRGEATQGGLEMSQECRRAAPKHSTLAEIADRFYFGYNRTAEEFCSDVNVNCCRHGG